MYVCMYIYIYTLYVYIQYTVLYIFIFIYLFIYRFIYLFIYLYIYLCIYLCICICIHQTKIGAGLYTGFGDEGQGRVRVPTSSHIQVAHLLYFQQDQPVQALQLAVHQSQCSHSLCEPPKIWKSHQPFPQITLSFIWFMVGLWHSVSHIVSIDRGFVLLRLAVEQECSCTSENHANSSWVGRRSRWQQI